MTSHFQSAGGEECGRLGIWVLILPKEVVVVFHRNSGPNDEISHHKTPV